MKEGVSYLYANSRASVLSTKLLTQDKFVRMAESENFAEALKVLTECNYGGVANESDLDKMLMEEEKSALDFFRDMITVEAIAKVFLLRYDYLNAKIAIKCKYLRLPMPNNLISGMFEASKLFSDIVKDDYDAFEIEMQSALNEIDNKFVDGDKSPMVIDLLCDKALYKNIARLSKDCKSAPIKEYLRRDADTVSLLSYYRAKNAKLDIQCFVNGGTLNQEAFLKVKGLSEVKQKDYFKQTPYYKLFLLCEDYLLGKTDISAPQKEAFLLKRNVLLPYIYNDGLEPLIIYYLNKKVEISNVRLTLICKKGGILPSVITERLKELYV